MPGLSSKLVGAQASVQRYSFPWQSCVFEKGRQLGSVCPSEAARSAAAATIRRTSLVYQYGSAVITELEYQQAACAQSLEVLSCDLFTYNYNSTMIVRMSPTGLEQDQRGIAFLSLMSCSTTVRPSGSVPRTG